MNRAAVHRPQGKRGFGIIRPANWSGSLEWDEEGQGGRC